MKKLFLNIHKNGNVTSSNYPIQESGAKFKALEVTEDEYQKALSGQFKVSFVKKKLILEQNPERELSPKLKKKLEIREKIENGTATDEDIKNALKLLL